MIEYFSKGFITFLFDKISFLINYSFTKYIDIFFNFIFVILYIILFWNLFMLV